MKRGEKVAMGFIAAMAVGLGLLTFEMESQWSERPEAAQSAFGGLEQSASLRLIPAGLAPSDLPDPGSRGAFVLGLYCAQCHDLPNPRMHTAKEWESVLGRMEQRMEAEGGGMLARVLRPSEQDMGVLAAYLHTHGLKAIDSAAAPSLDTAPGRSFSAVCAECHSLPDPAQHTPSEWRLVVARMTQNIAKSGRPVPGDEVLAGVLSYLSEHARSEALE